ncbi:hypothetical protein UW163_11535 [Ralstonia solanacearum]|nr:hypothetical protein UW163_11535 [Ralstonia solanacearum]
MEWGAGYGAKAEALHRNAELLTAFQLKLAQTLAQIDAGKSVTDKDVDDLRLEYEAIKDKCPYNHMPADDALFRAHQRFAKEFADGNGKPLMSCYVALLTRARWRASEFWFFGMVWAFVLGSLGYSWWLPKS